MDEKRLELYNKWLESAKNRYERKKRLESPMEYSLEGAKTRIKDLMDQETTLPFSDPNLASKYKPARDPKTGRIDPNCVVKVGQHASNVGPEGQKLICGPTGSDDDFLNFRTLLNMEPEAIGDLSTPEDEVEKAYGDLMQYDKGTYGQGPLPRPEPKYKDLNTWQRLKKFMGTK